MSLETWKQEFYPIPAGEVPVDQAAEHSLRKWIGLRPENLTRHGVSSYGRSLIDDERQDLLAIDGESCALCVHHLDNFAGCPRCPLCLHLGGPCDLKGQPYHVFLHTGDPKPMIAALQAVVDEQNKEATPCPSVNV